MRYAAIGEHAIIQGDIVLGKLADVRQRTLYNLVDQANQIGDIDQLDLTPEQKAVLKALKDVKVPADIAATIESRRESRARRLLFDIVKLEPQSKGLTNYPETEIAAMKKEQAKHAGANVAAFSAIQLGAQYRWPGGVIPYTIDPNAPNQQMIAAAIDMWNIQTDRINLRPLQAGDRDYVRVSCSAAAAVRRSDAPGRRAAQSRLSSGCLF